MFGCWVVILVCIWVLGRVGEGGEVVGDGDLLWDVCVCEVRFFVCVVVVVVGVVGGGVNEMCVGGRKVNG